MPKAEYFLRLNGVTYSQAEIQLISSVKISEVSTPAWEKSLFRFLNEWLNSSRTIVTYTSGSTGKPKKISLSKKKMVLSAKCTIDFLKLKSDGNALLCLSCEHIAGKMMVVRAILSQMNLIAVEPSTYALKNLLHEKIDFAAFVPLQISALIEDEQYRKKTETIKNIIIGGTEISQLLKKKLNGFNNNVYETFGMTETISHIAMKLISKNNNQSYFETLNKVEVRADNNKRLIIHAKYLSSKPIHTNDVVKIISKRKFLWLGRFDNIVNSGGMKLYPETIEQKLKPHISYNFFLSGMRDEKLGQKLVMIIESENEINKQEILDTIKLFSERFEIPRDIFYVNKFMKTPSGKLNRKETMKLLSDNIEYN
jgi:o-succinylbenzoate---CoA ligase